MFVITTTLWWERGFNYDGKTDIIQKGLDERSAIEILGVCY